MRGNLSRRSKTRGNSGCLQLTRDRAGRLTRLAFSLALGLGVVHCGGRNPSDGGGDANDVTGDATMDVTMDTTPEAAAPSVVHFNVPATGPIAWGEVGFPSDLYRSADGHIELGALPVPDTRRTAWEPVRQHLELRRGFCVGCSAFFRIDGDLDRATVPSDASPGDHATTSDALMCRELCEVRPNRHRALPSNQCLPHAPGRDASSVGVVGEMDVTGALNQYPREIAP